MVTSPLRLRSGFFSLQYREPRPAAPYHASRIRALQSAGQEVSQRAFERAEPGLEVPPLVDALFIYRLANLLGARGAHAAICPVELYAGGLERQSEEVQQAADIAFEILDDALVLHAQDPPRQHRVPVGHGVDIRTVVAPDVLEAVGELLSRGEELLEVAEGAGERLAAGIDDARVRQDEVDQADVAEVVRHLVDEVRLIRAVHARVRDVFLAEAQPLRRGEIREQRRVARRGIPVLASAQLLNHARNVRELHRALDLRVRGEDLLDEGRPGARQPDDEDRIRPLAAAARAGGEEFAGAEARLQAETPLHGAEIEAALGFLERVAPLVVAEGFLVFAAVLERLAERETEVVPIDELRGVGGLDLAHARELLVREAVGLQVSEAPVGIAEVRPRRRSGPVRLDRLRLVSLRLECVRNRKVQLRILRGLGEELPIHAERFRVVAEPDARRRIHRAESAAAGIDLQELARFLERGGVLVALAEHHRVVVARDVIARVEGEQALEEEFGIVEHVELQADLREEPHRLEMIAVLQEKLPQDPLGPIDIALGKHPRSR